MRLLLTSAGIANPSIQQALVDLLGKPIADCDALFVPTALYPFTGGPQMAWKAITGETHSRMTKLGWKSLGLLEPSVLPSIDKAAWVPAVQQADAVLVAGGDPVFLANHLRRSGLTDVLGPDTVYVGVSAGAIATATTFVETYTEPPHGDDSLETQNVVFNTPDGDVDRILVKAPGVGLVDFAVIPHYDNPDHPDASPANAALWASHIPIPTYAIDDQTAIAVTDTTVDVVSEGTWKLFS